MKLIEQDKFSLELHGQLMCAVCDKPVDKIEYIRDPYLRNGVNFRAYCHSKTETIFLPEELILDSSISFGKAFLSQPQLENK